MQVIDGEREARLSWRAVRRLVPVAGRAAHRARHRRRLDRAHRRRARHRRRGVAADRLGAPDRAHRRARSADRRRSGAPGRAPSTRRSPRAPAPRGTLVGIAGTVTTLAAMAQRLDSYDATRVHGSRCHAADVDALVAIARRDAARRQAAHAGARPQARRRHLRRRRHPRARDGARRRRQLPRQRSRDPLGPGLRDDRRLITRRARRCQPAPPARSAA